MLNATPVSVARTCIRSAEAGVRLRYPLSPGKTPPHSLSFRAVADVFTIPPSRPSVSPLSLHSRLLRNGADFIGCGTQSSHEIAGTAVRVGSKVKGIKVGDRVGVGAQCASCYECNLCKNDNECYCPKQIDTYVRVPLELDRINALTGVSFKGAKHPDGVRTQGGYSTGIIVNELFCFPIPDGVTSADACSMLCGGLTVFSPLVRNGAGPGVKVGVIGIGGLVSIFYTLFSAGA